jgi:hypothetical protein
MSLRNLHLGASFDEIISIFPGSISNFNLSNNTLNEENEAAGLDHEVGDETSDTFKNPADSTAPARDKLKLNLKSTSNNSADQIAFISAIYNTLAMGILIACLGLCALLYYVLSAFIRPILWAILTSAFLFSFKRYLTEIARKRLEQIEKNNKMLAMELALLPISTLDSTVDWMWSFISEKYRQLAILFSLLVLFNLSSSFSNTLVTALGLCAHYLSSLTTLMSYNYIIDYYSTWQFTFTLLVAYLLAIVFYWNESYTTFFQFLSLPIWLSLFLLSSKLMGSYRPLFIIAFLILICIGFYSILFDFVQKNKGKYRFRKSPSRPKTGTTAAAAGNTSGTDGNGNEDDLISSDSMISKEEEPDEYFEDVDEENEVSGAEDNGTSGVDYKNMSTSSASDSHTNSPNTTIFKTTLINMYHTSVHYFNTSLNASATSKPDVRGGSARRRKEDSDKFFVMLFWLFLCVKLRYDFYIVIPILVIVWKLLKQLLLFVYDSVVSSQSFRFYGGKLTSWVRSRIDVFAPKPFQIIFKLFVKGEFATYILTFSDKLCISPVRFSC